MLKYAEWVPDDGKYFALISQCAHQGGRHYQSPALCRDLALRRVYWLSFRVITGLLAVVSTEALTMIYACLLPETCVTDFAVLQAYGRKICRGTGVCFGF